MDSRFQIFGAKTTPDIRSGFLGIVIGPETILPDMFGGPTDFREDCCGRIYAITAIKHCFPMH